MKKITKTIPKLLGGTLAVIFFFFILLIVFLALSDCNWYMPYPCPDNWDPINECIKGHDCTD